MRHNTKQEHLKYSDNYYSVVFRWMFLFFFLSSQNFVGNTSIELKLKKCNELTLQCMSVESSKIKYNLKVHSGNRRGRKKLRSLDLHFSFHACIVSYLGTYIKNNINKITIAKTTKTTTSTTIKLLE